MEITEVRIKLVEKSSERLRAFCSVTFDGDFVVRDLKVIDGTSGPFVAMPSRKLMDRCSRCGAKNHLRAKFCNECGQRLNENRAPKDSQGRAKLHADVAHPINAACRERIQKAVVQAYQEELERAKSPDYKPASYDDYEDYEEPGAGRGTQDSKAEADTTPPPAREENTPQGGGDPADHGFGDYNDLIADLKRQAETRRGERQPPRAAREEASPPPSPPREPAGASPAQETGDAADSPTRPAPTSAPDPDEEFGSGL